MNISTTLPILENDVVTVGIKGVRFAEYRKDDQVTRGSEERACRTARDGQDLDSIVRDSGRLFDGDTGLRVMVVESLVLLSSGTLGVSRVAVMGALADEMTDVIASPSSSNASILVANNQITHPILMHATVPIFKTGLQVDLTASLSCIRRNLLVEMIGW